MPLLTLVQNTCKRISIASPTQVVGNTDAQIIQLLGLANEEGSELADRGNWQALTFEATHTTLATESQGLMTAITNASFNRILVDTFWNRSMNVPVYPVSPEEWQRMKAAGVTGPYPNFRIRGNYLLMYPTPTAGQMLAFEWISNYFCQDTNGDGRTAWAADTDTGRLDEDLMVLGLTWRWKAAKGLDYAEDFNIYEAAVLDALARDGAKPHLSMNGGGGRRFMSNRNISQGSWS